MSDNRSESGLAGSPGGQRQPVSLAATIGDPLREVHTLKRRVQIFTYAAILASEPFYYFVLDFTWVQLLPGLAIGLAIAFIAIEGAFYQMFRLRKRSAYPGVLHQALGMVAGENAAGEQALRAIAHLLRVKDGCIATARSGELQVKWALNGSLDLQQDCIAELREPIAKAIRSGEPVEAAYPGPLPAGVKAPGIVVVPLVALQRTVGALILRADEGADIGDAQLLKDIGVALALSLANWGQREDLRESEERIKTVVTNVPVVLFAIDQDGVFTLSEGKGLDDLGLKPGEIVGLNVADVYGDSPEVLESVQRALSGKGFADTLEVGGFWWETNYSPVFDEESGTVSGVIGVAANVTARLKAETAVRESEELYRTLVETSPDAVLLISPDGLVVKANLRAAELLGFEDPSKMANLNARDFFSEGDLERVVAHIERDGSAGAAGENEYLFLRQDGSTVPVEVSLAALTDSDGNNVGYMGVARDITERKLTDEALRRSEEKYRDLVENSNEIIYTLDRNAVVTYISPAVQPIGGFTPEEVIGRPSTEFIHPDDLSEVAMSLQKVLSGGTDPSEYRLLTKAGGFRWVRSASKPIYEGSEVVGVRGVLVDITEKREAEDALRASEERFRALVENGADGVVLMDAEGTITYAGPSTESILGWASDEMVGMHQSELIHPDDLERVYQFMSGLLEAPGESMQIELRSKHKDGSWRWIEAVGTNLLNTPSVGAIVGNYRDITERRNSEQTIRQLAYHDALTGLPNRALFEDRLKIAVAQARRAGEELAVMFLDLDRFKLVNDTLGHGAGDKLLSMVADELTSLLRDSDTVARVGGDEFTLFLPKISGSADAMEVADRILEKVKQPKRIAGQEFRVTTSIGITVFPGHGDDPETLLRNADTAMYQAKERGRDRHQLFTPAMNARVVERLSLENDLRRALEREEFVVYYQPFASIASGQIVGAEALVRWNHPDRGLVMPDEFIPFAEETGLIVPLGEWVLKEAVVEAKRWIDAGLPELRLAVNLSARQLQDEKLVEMVASTLRDSGFPSGQLQLEITEGAMMDNVESAIRIVKELRHLGLGFAVDDFGTGYSSLSYLKRFPIDTVKIDRSFVRDLTIDPNDAAIVVTVLAMARSLGLHVVAEGVETRQQLEFLREHNCDDFQGYLLSRPIPADEYMKLVSSAELARPRKRKMRTPAHR